MKRWWIFQLSSGEQVRLELSDDEVETIRGACELGVRWIRVEGGNLINAEHLVRLYVEESVPF